MAYMGKMLGAPDAGGTPTPPAAAPVDTSIVRADVNAVPIVVSPLEAPDTDDDSAPVKAGVDHAVTNP